MNTDVLVDLLEDEELFRYFPNLVVTIKKLIFNDVDIKITISDNIYSSKHFLEIYKSRQEFLEKFREGKKESFGKIINVLQDWDGDVKSGHISSKGKHIAFLISDELDKIVVLLELKKNKGSILGRS